MIEDIHMMIIVHADDCWVHDNDTDTWTILIDVDDADAGDENGSENNLHV